MMACASGMADERAFLDALGKVAMWKIDDNRLALADSGGETLARFEAGPMPPR